MKRRRPAASGLVFDYTTLRLGRQLTDQQLWCLGADVREKSLPFDAMGLRYFSRPRKDAGCGRLTGMLPDGGHLSMWGFGFLAGDATHGALWLDRKGFRPALVRDWDPRAPIWDLRELPAARAPQAEAEVDAVLFLLIQLAERMADYEADVLALAGEAARQDVIAQWKFRNTALPVAEVPAAWRRVARVAGDLRREIPAMVEGAVV